MIAVIADDLTGAAEIGGIGLQYGLKVEISSTVNQNSDAGLLIINTDTRSKNQSDAINTVASVCRELKVLQPALIYKKIDSVLRGHVLAEIITELAELDLPAALIVPANPALERTLVNRTYFVGNVPVHQTSFLKDPEFPVADADVIKMLKAEEEQVTVLKPGDAVPGQGIAVGEGETVDDLANWAKRVNANMLAAGGSGFFEAILNNGNISNSQPTVPLDVVSNKSLYISGTTYEESVQLVETLYNQGGPVSYMPLAVNDGSINLSEVWCREIIDSLQKHNKAVMAIRQSDDTHYSASHLRSLTAGTVRQVFNKIEVDELIIEGGSTASAVLNGLCINTLYPVQELSPGTIRSKADYKQDLHITLKPGSYKWSPGLWKF